MPRFQVVAAKQLRSVMLFDELPHRIGYRWIKRQLFEASLRHDLVEEIVDRAGVRPGVDGLRSSRAVRRNQCGQPVGEDVVTLGPLFRDDGLYQ